jgi:hypothetical protein
MYSIELAIFKSVRNLLTMDGTCEVLRGGEEKGQNSVNATLCEFSAMGMIVYPKYQPLRDHLPLDAVVDR